MNRGALRRYLVLRQTLRLLVVMNVAILTALLIHHTSMSTLTVNIILGMVGAWAVIYLPLAPPREEYEDEED
jgi:hypothetical protein